MRETRELVLDEPIVTGNTKAAVRAAGGGSSDLWTVPPSALHYDPRDNVRTLDPERVRHVADLIKVNGYDRKKPIGCIVKKVDGADRIYVYEGQHRYHGALLAIREGADIERLPIVIDEAKSVNRANLIVAGVTNNDGEKLTPLELAAAVVELQRLHVDQATICKRLGISDQTVRDVVLLANAPEQIHSLVRSKTVSSTLAIAEIRQHGAEKALDRLTAAASNAKASGKSKITKKVLEKPAAFDKIGAPQAKQLLQALQAVLHDPVFGNMSPGTIAGVHAALLPLADLLYAAPKRASQESLQIESAGCANDYAVTPPDDEGNVEPSEIFAPGGRPGDKPYAEIRIAQYALGNWVMATSVSLGTEGRSSPLKVPPNAASRVWPTRAQAIGAAIVEIGTYIDVPSRKKVKQWSIIKRWLERLMADSEVDKVVCLMQGAPEPRKGTLMHPPAVAWPFPTELRRAV